jgi:hypothetical protein
MTALLIMLSTILYEMFRTIFPAQSSVQNATAHQAHFETSKPYGTTKIPSSVWFTAEKSIPSYSVRMRPNLDLEPNNWRILLSDQNWARFHYHLHRRLIKTGLYNLSRAKFSTSPMSKYLFHVQVESLYLRAQILR